MTLTWEAVSGLIAIVLLVCAANAMYVQYAIGKAIDGLFVRLNGTYMRAEVCAERHGDHGRRLDALESE